MTETILETRTCPQCSTSFAITDVDQKFLDTLTPTIGGKPYAFPHPTLCPLCRKMRRFAWRNEKNIYKRKCDATGKDIISLFSPNAPCPVYTRDSWYSDTWDAKDYGRDVDFTRPFFEQWHDLKKVVPMPGKSVSYSMENSDYSDNCGGLKNCYLCFNAGHSEDSLYCIDIWNTQDCIDCITTENSQWCYELLSGTDCYKVYFSYDVKDSRESRYLYHCRGCQNCYGCFDLENKEYAIFNKSYSPEEYRAKLASLLALPQEEQKKQVRVFLEKAGYKKADIENIGSENVHESTGVNTSKNISFSRCIDECEDVRYTSDMRSAKVVLDSDTWWDRVECVYEAEQIGDQCSHVYFSLSCWSNVSNLLYCSHCITNVHDCFGSIGLRDASYCILNKQYTKEEYDILVPKIIAHMITTGEWGEFFPPHMSHFGYNQTINMTTHPLSKEEALEDGYTWSDYEAPFPKVAKTLPGARLPDSIREIPDDILNWAIECEVTKKPFRIMPSELEFYRKNNLPAPRRHPDQRYLDRIAKISPS